MLLNSYLLHWFTFLDAHFKKPYIKKNLMCEQDFMSLMKMLLKKALPDIADTEKGWLHLMAITLTCLLPWGPILCLTGLHDAVAPHPTGLLGSRQLQRDSKDSFYWSIPAPRSPMGLLGSMPALLHKSSKFKGAYWAQAQSIGSWQLLLPPRSSPSCPSLAHCPPYSTSMFPLPTYLHSEQSGVHWYPCTFSGHLHLSCIHRVRGYEDEIGAPVSRSHNLICASLETRAALFSAGPCFSRRHAEI